MKLAFRILFMQTYLTDEDFQHIMGMTVEEFKSMTLWRQRELKKKVGLF